MLSKNIIPSGKEVGPAEPGAVSTAGSLAG